GGGRLHAHELLGRLGAVSQGQLGLGVEVGRLLHHLQQLARGDVAQDLAGPAGVAHVALDEAGVGPADLGAHLGADEVDDLVHVEALVGLAPAEDGDVDHQCSLFQYTPTVVCAATSRNGLTPLTPSQGYLAYGGSRSPSSRSGKRGMKNSLVSVVNSTRPGLP